MNIVYLILIVIMIALIFSTRKDFMPKVSEHFSPVQAWNIQNTVDAIQETKPGFPIRTIYYNPNPDGTFLSRFLFYDTQTQKGVQYDVTTDPSGSKILSLSEQVDPDFKSPFEGFKAHGSINKGADATPVIDFKDIADKYEVSS
jgi:hypothetical protein